MPCVIQSDNSQTLVENIAFNGHMHVQALSLGDRGEPMDPSNLWKKNLHLMLLLMSEMMQNHLQLP